MWYFGKDFADYPRTLILTVPGCYNALEIKHNRIRYERAGLILKQSDVTGRKMTVVAPASCKATAAHIEY